VSADTNFKVDYIAALARLDISEDEAGRYQEQLDGIISYIEELGQVDVAGIEPTAHPAPVLDRLRDDDSPAFSIPREAVLENAPDQALNQIRVPKVVDA
jgi:aspartyl-tRNA(Asn)/glutamyl-tRNA(Gln) amidotransferase subunit C